MILMCDLQMRWHQLSLLLSTGYGGILQPILVGWFIYFGFGMACWYDSVGRFCLERGFSLLFLSVLSLFLLISPGSSSFLFSSCFSSLILSFSQPSLFPSLISSNATQNWLLQVTCWQPFFCPLLFILLFFPLFSLWSAPFCYVLVSLHWSVPRQQNPHGTGWIWHPVNESGTGSIW